MNVKNKIILLFFFSHLVFSCGIPKDLSVNEKGELKKCPKSPNCVSTQAANTDKRHYIDSWSFEDAAEAKEKIKKAISDFGNAEIITEKENYFHAVFITGFWRYKDDVEFYFDQENKLIHFRSASRLGYSDQGVNRERMEALKTLYSR